jgi:hypothetical protein
LGAGVGLVVFLGVGVGFLGVGVGLGVSVGLAVGLGKAGVGLADVGLAVASVMLGVTAVGLCCGIAALAGEDGDGLDPGLLGRKNPTAGTTQQHTTTIATAQISKMPIGRFRKAANFDGVFCCGGSGTRGVTYGHHRVASNDPCS